MINIQNTKIVRLQFWLAGFLLPSFFIASICRERERKKKEIKNIASYKFHSDLSKENDLGDSNRG